jgi:methanogenic corrinoid protein MtbC1
MPGESGMMLINAVGELDEPAALSAARKLLDAGLSGEEILNLLQQGMRLVGERYENGAYFIADLIMSGILFRKVAGLAVSEGYTGQERIYGKILLGTVLGDIHDLGKNVIRSMLDYYGYQTVDLGVDVSPEDFAAAALEYAPDIIILSGVLDQSRVPMGRTIGAIRKWVGDVVKIVAGGPCIDERSALHFGADAYMRGAYESLEVCRRLIGGDTQYA